MIRSMEKHIPVLLNEVIENLNIKEDGIYLDLTLGRGGHSSVILSKCKKGLLIGYDQDESAIKESAVNLSKVASNFLIVHDNFCNFDNFLKEKNIEAVDGILMDLGVSSPQFDNPMRGFSYRFDATLDMRMDQRNSLTAKQVVNEYSLERLSKLFQEYGDEKFAYSIAKNIVKARQVKLIETTFELVDIIKKSKPMKVLKKEGHPAKQVFQALRIEVNNEYGVLKEAIVKALKYLKHNGRLAIITFHSGEDRIVKNFFKENTVVIGDRIDGPNTREEKDYFLVNNKPIVARNEELEINPRSKSAKLRIIQRK